MVINNAQEGGFEDFYAIGTTSTQKKSPNLVDMEYISDENNYEEVSVGSAKFKAAVFSLKPNTAYTLSAKKRTTKPDGSAISSYINVSIANTNGQRGSIVNTEKGTMTSGADGIIYICVNNLTSPALAWLDTWENIQLEEGSVNTDYKPYSPYDRIVNAGKYNEETERYDISIVFTDNVNESIAAVSLEKGLSKWDRLERRDGVWGISYNTETILLYNGESIESEFVSPSGELTLGEPVQYKVAERFYVLDSSEQAALNALHMYSDITKIINDANMMMSLTYIVSKTAKAESYYVSVKDFGALGDGVTDDTDAIRKARNAARLNSKPLYFPAGTYMLRGCIQIFSDMRIIGEKGAVLKKFTATVQNLTKAAAKGDSTVYVADVSGFKVGQDVFIGSTASGSYSDTVGYITAIDANAKSITFDVYPRHSDNPKAGLNQAVATTGVISTSFSMLCTFSRDDSGGNIVIEGLEFDGNKIPSEPLGYELSPIHIDPNKMNVTVERCHVVSSNADGISLQNAGQTTVHNCIVEGTSFHGIHPGYTHEGVNISDCFIYDCPDSGVFDCYNIDSLNITNVFFKNCKNGIGGLDSLSNGTNITGCTFWDCDVGVGANAYEGGVSIAGCSFQYCAIGVKVYVAGTVTITGCVFQGGTTVLHLARASYVVFNGNMIKDCKTPVVCDVQPSQPTLRSSDIIINGNIFVSIASGTGSKIAIKYMDNAFIRNNMLIGSDCIIEVESASTSNILVDGNNVEKTSV